MTGVDTGIKPGAMVGMAMPGGGMTVPVTVDTGMVDTTGARGLIPVIACN